MGGDDKSVRYLQTNALLSAGRAGCNFPRPQLAGFAPRSRGVGMRLAIEIPCREGIIDYLRNTVIRILELPAIARVALRIFCEEVGVGVDVEDVEYSSVHLRPVSAYRFMDRESW